ncbi:hypothetical protein ABC337_18230 [Arthrobacter sp. 1P04PC]|uniref:hypothetical protein n=1 Tax=unclassified Arthrobacter TaxID=235627 RepID=UPI0039A3E291
MSEETARRLEAAQAEVESLTAVAEERERGLLAAVAEQLPGRVDAVAKSVAQGQPSITRSLGREGVSELRDALRARALEIGAMLTNAPGNLKFPWLEPGFFTTEKTMVRDIQGQMGEILSEYFRGNPGDSLADIFIDRGFDPGQNKDLPGAHCLSRACDLFEERDIPLTAFAQAHAALRKARLEAERAQSAEDRAAIDSLWE